MPDLTGDLLIIVPSRGRPGNIARLLDSVHETARMRTRLHICVDDDDEQLPGYEYAMGKAAGEHDRLEQGPRKGLCSWTNQVAVRRAAEYPYLASLGDDHVPMTPGWDKALIRGIERMGGTGFTYPWDGRREDIPEAVVMSSDIVQALGWMCMPDLDHWYCDVAWADLGRGAGCLRFLRAIAVDHFHPRTGKASVDDTYSEASPKLDADRDAYYAWRRDGRMAADIGKIVALRENALVPA